ncbi:MAG: hypothetical protein HY049_14950, partial [Acidobacteria bacterium]|nr:hypothetical protein [Acidobacteriota bacterium]
MTSTGAGSAASPTVASHEARNPIQRIHAYFTSRGVAILPEPTPSPGWKWGLAIRSIGYSGEMGDPGRATVSASANRIELDWATVHAWYVNDDRGLEHAFIFDEPPEGTLPEGPAPVQIDFAIAGNLARKISDDGRSAYFLAPGVEEVLHLGSLLALDAEDRDLPARFELVFPPESSAAALRLVVEASDAVYPIALTMMLTSPIATSKGPPAGTLASETVVVTPGIQALSGFQIQSIPSNDTCAGGEVIAPSGPFPYLTAVTGDVTDATTTGDPPAPSCQPGFPLSRSIWYAFTPTTTASYTISSCSDAPTGTTLDDPLIAIYTSTGGCGGPFTQVVGACDDDSCTVGDFQAVVTTSLNAGTTYYVVVWRLGSTAPPAGNTAVQLRVTRRTLNPPANDQCSGAEAIPSAGPFPYLTSVTSNITDATTLGDPPAPSCQSSVTRSIWYSFTPTVSGDYSISSCADAPTGTTVDDTVVAVYTSSGGCGGPFTQVPGSCDDDSCATEALQASSSANLVAGTTYYVVVFKVGGTDPTAGNTAVQLRLNSQPPPANDTCLAATSLALDTPVTGTNAHAFDDYELSGASCFTGIGQVSSAAVGRDAAYAFTAPFDGSYSFRVTNYGATSNLVHYLSSTCPSGVAPNVVTSCLGAGNRTSTGSAEEVICVPLAAGQTVYPIVDEGSLTAGSSYKIEANRCNRETEPNGTPATASALTCGLEGTISPAGDADFFSLGTPVSGSRVFALADGVAANST